MRLPEADYAVRRAVRVTRLDMRPDHLRLAVLRFVRPILEHVLMAVRAPRHGSECAALNACEHDWMERGTPGDLWQECFLCGKQRDRP